MEDNTCAVIYPLEQKYIQRFYEGNKDIFVKYTPYTSTKLVEGNKLLFYRTKSDKKIIGEATIINIDFYDVNTAFHKYGERIFLNWEELTKYSGGRTKKMLVLELNKFMKYKNLVSAKKNITMIGLHLNNSEYADLFSRTL
jgi:hypothetical protein